MIEAHQQCLVEQFIAHLAIEAFDNSILDRSARRNVMPFDLLRHRSGQHRIRHKLGAVVRDCPSSDPLAQNMFLINGDAFQRLRLVGRAAEHR